MALDEQPLARLTRIQRGDSVPSFAASDASRRHRFPGRAQVSSEVQLFYRTTRNYCLAGIDRAVVKSDLAGVLVANEQPIGTFSAAQFTVRTTDNDAFYGVMDGSSATESELAYILCRHWNDFSREVAWAGPIVHIESAWIDKRYASHDLLRLARRAVTEAIWCDYSLVVMKACPLEYSGLDISAESPLKVAQSRRRAAMIRYYERVFGSHPFPGNCDWLWALHPRLRRKSDIAQPTLQR
jgi:hypothetical protein